MIIFSLSSFKTLRKTKVHFITSFLLKFSCLKILLQFLNHETELYKINLNFFSVKFHAALEIFLPYQFCEV